jgi:hypothetical protein
MAHEHHGWLARVSDACARVRARSKSPVLGCTDREIEELLGRLGLTQGLPEAYQAFLVEIGSAPGDLLRGSDLRCSSLEHLQREFEQVRLAVGGAEVPHDAFVYLGHQDYEFCWFRLSERPDPPVYSFSEARPQVHEPLGQTYSEHLRSLARQSLGAAGLVESK